MSELNIWSKSVSTMCNNVNALMQYETSTSYQVPIWVEPKLELLNNNVDDFNFEMSYIKSLGSENAYSKWQGKFITKETVRCCYVEYLAHVKIGSTNTDTLIHNVILVGNNMGTDAYTDAMFDVKNVGCVTAYSQGAVRHDNSGRNIYPAQYGTWQYTSFESFGLNFLRTSTLNDSNLTSAVNNMMCEDNTEMFNFLRAVATDVPTSFFGGNTRSQYTGSNFFNGLWFYPLGAHAYDYTISKSPFPVFKIEDTTSIIDYLLTGNDSGAIDPFDPSKKQEKINNKLSNYRVFAYRDDSNKARTKFSVVCYNEENIAKWDRLVDDWRLIVLDTIDGVDYKEVSTRGGMKYPQINFTHLMETSLYSLGVGFENFSLSEFDVNPFIRIQFQKSDTSENHVKSTGVWYEGTTSRENIVDGYRYTSSNGYWVEVLYRAPDMKDINGGYPTDADDEDDTTGTDDATIIGNGLNTFNITTAQFGTINAKMWSTDWANVFKSNSIDPIKCVISCKSIPFTASASSSSDVIIANMNTGVHANTVKPVKSYIVGSYLMPHFRGDFSDITMTQVRIYLPFIGWVELPGAEVISRVAYANQSDNAKRLGFKYLVDFVDGSCRCVISVNGTERWYFDGNCGIDVPITSDNHTQAVGNAIRSGVGSVLSLASAVGGAVGGNGMMVATGIIGAIGNGINTFPTYSYSASASPSGYINASMNTHIMIVIEHPNMIEADDYAHKYGKPCGLTLPLGSVRGFTRCSNVDTSGINGTPNELSMIKSALESGVYL